MAVKRIRRALRNVRHAEPGERFESTHERHRIRNQPIRLTVIAFGLVLMAVAALTFWVPGPNFVLVLAGLALVAGQWRMVAKLLDRGEVAARRWHQDAWTTWPAWRRRCIIIAIWLVGVSIAVTIAWFTWLGDAIPASWPFVG
jgi:hypothetical protein